MSGRDIQIMGPQLKTNGNESSVGSGYNAWVKIGGDFVRVMVQLAVVGIKAAVDRVGERRRRQEGERQSYCWYHRTFDHYNCGTPILKSGSVSPMPAALEKFPIYASCYKLSKFHQGNELE